MNGQKPNGGPPHPEWDDPPGPPIAPAIFQMTPQPAGSAQPAHTSPSSIASGPASIPPAAGPGVAHEPEGNIGPDRLTKVPGVVGELVDWNVSSARRPNRMLALGAALTIVGTLIGRRVAGPTNSATHLYCVALAGTAAGKQHAIDCIKNALCAAGAMDTIGPGDFASSRAVVNFVTRVTLSLCAMDEFGSFLHRINSKNAGHYERDITGELRKLWGISWSRYDSSETANTKSETVHSPALSIYGTATPQDFYTAVKSPDIGNGFLNRFLILETGPRGPEQFPPANAAKIKPFLEQNLRKLYLPTPHSIPILNTIIGTGQLGPAQALQWGAGAEDVYALLSAAVDAESDRSELSFEAACQRWLFGSRRFGPRANSR